MRRRNSVQLRELTAQLRRGLGPVQPVIPGGRIRTAFLGGIRLRARVRRNRLHCCASSIGTSVNTPIRSWSRRRRPFENPGTVPGFSWRPLAGFRLPDEVGDEEGRTEHARVLAERERPEDANAGVVRRAQQCELLAPGSAPSPCGPRPRPPRRGHAVGVARHRRSPSPRRSRSHLPSRRSAPAPTRREPVPRTPGKARLQVVVRPPGSTFHFTAGSD